MSKEIHFFGLLHLKKKENLKLNFKSRNEREKHIIYLKNAIVLNEQLKNLGYNFELITNNKKYLEFLLKELNFYIKIKEINFKTYVPPNTHFYACHYRVDIFRYLSSLKNSYSILIDLDVLVLKKLYNLEKKKNLNIALVNDITHNVLPAYGEKNILKKLNILNSKTKYVRWYGGDFFCGNSDFYKLLFEKTRKYQKKFVENISYLKNQTDELFMSLAIEDIRKNYKIENCEKNKYFSRYWNANVKHKQKKLNYYLNFPLLHIPADKVFLSKCFEEIKYKKKFKKEYISHVKSVINRLRLLLSNIKSFFLKHYINDN